MTHEEKMKRMRRAVELGREQVYTRAEGPITAPSQRNAFDKGFYEQIDPYTKVHHHTGWPGFYIEEGRKRVYDALGVNVKGRKIPKSAHGSVEVEGVKFVLHEHIPAKSGNKYSERAHRLYAICPMCGKDIPAGRMHQHAVVHNENRPLKMARGKSR